MQASFTENTNNDFSPDSYLVEESKLDSFTKQSSPSQPSSSEIDAELRRDPEEEYFRLSVLSLKMQYNERDTDFVFSISSTRLFRTCKDNNIPFHRWYNWIEGQLI